MKTEKKQHLKGSVLFTVVSVMSLLVIFLMGTLVLATSASNRSHKNYSTSQAEYTARAAIESFSQAMGRNAAIAQTVVNMSKNDVIEPTVVIDETGMGSVGYYDAGGDWVNDKIQIEYIDDTYVYADDKWEAQQVLRVTATARVGKEESTVSAYIRKKAPNEPNPLSIKGFQTLGGGGYTTTSGYVSGAISMGILDDGNQDYALNNDSIYDTEMSFVNGTLNVGAQIDILASQPGVGTVIMGDLNANNGNGVNIKVDYSYANRDSSTEAWEYVDLTHKLIPYLYVDGNLNIANKFSVTATGVNTVTQLRNGAPFNVFCGSLKHSGNNINVAADIYIMGNEGNSQFGTGGGTSRLNAWTDSILNKTDTQFHSEGGSIYSNENLTLGHAVIRGDVHVNGNLTINGNVTIYGDLVVTGTINKTPQELANIVRGDIYNGTNAQTGTGGLKEGYYSVENTYVSGEYLVPGYVKVQNIEYPNIEVENVQYANYAVDGQVTGIEQTINIPYEESELVAEMPATEIILTSKLDESTNWQTIYIDESGYDYADKVIYNASGAEVTINDIPVDWNAGGVKHFYEINGAYYEKMPYVDAKTGVITANVNSYYLIYLDGTYTDIVPEDLVIYQADKDGNMSDIVTDSFSVIYRVDPEGNITDEVWTDLYTYYEPDKDGNPIYTTDAEGNNVYVVATSNSFIYRADINGNPTTEITTDNFTYYATSDTASENPISEADAVGTAVKSSGGSYLAWYNSNLDLGENSAFCYYNADPAAAPSYADDPIWYSLYNAETNPNGHQVSEAEAFESVAIYPISAYTGANKEIYPSKMTREAINGEEEGGKYKVITTLADIKESIGCSPDGTFSSNTYYKEVPNAVISGGKYEGFEYVTVNSGNTYEIDQNTVIQTGTTNSGDITVNVNPNGGELWIVLDGCNFGAANDMHRIIVSGNGTVNFFIKGNVSAEKFGIYTKDVYDQVLAGGKVIVREDDKLNINYYGSEGSTLNLANNCITCGIAKCPYTDIKLADTAGVSGNYTYISSAGVSTSYGQVAWIGNALFKGKSGGNNFTLLYTGSSADSEPIYNEFLKESWKVMYYDVY